MPSNSRVTMQSSFNDHQAWLKSLHELHAEHMAARAANASPLPSAPMTWALPEEANSPARPSGFGGFYGDVDERFASSAESFAGIALSDDDFDGPVYRSLGGMPGAMAVDDFGFDDEPLRYRSLGEPAPLARAESSFGMADPDRAWLETMPPLIQRQNARGLSIP